MGSTIEEKPRKVDTKIFEIIEKLVKLETLLEAFNDANDKDHVLIKEGLASALKSIYDQDKRLDDLEKSQITLKTDCEKRLLEMKTAYDRMKWIWGAIAFIITPIITALIMWALRILGLIA